MCEQGSMSGWGSKGEDKHINFLVQIEGKIGRKWVCHVRSTWDEFHPFRRTKLTEGLN